MNERKAPISRLPAAPAKGIQRFVDPAEPGQAERPIAGVLLGIWRGRWIVVACVLLSLVYGYIRVRYTVPIYSASSTIVVPSSPSILPDSLNTSGQSPNYLLTQCQIIHSTALMTKALKQPGVSEAVCLRGSGNPVAYLKNAVIVGPDKQGGDLIDVEMQSLDPRDAATIVNGVVSAYINYQSESHAATAVEVMKMLQNEINQQETELKQEQQKVTDFKKSNPDLVQQIDQGKAAGSPLTAQLQQAQMKRLELQIANDRAAHLKNDPEALKQVADGVSAIANLPVNSDPIVDPILLEQYRSVRQELLIQGPGQEKQPAVIQLQARESKLEHDVLLQRQEAAKKYLSLLTEQLDAARDREAAIQKAVNDESNKWNSLYSRKAEYDQLNELVENTHQGLDMLYTRYKTVTITGNVGVLTASVLEPAKPFETTGTGKSQKLGMALVVGLMAGLGGALLREMLEQRLRTVDEVTRLLNAPILGSVPNIVSRPGRLLPSIQTPNGASWSNYLRGNTNRNRRQWSTVQSLMQRGQAMHLQPRSDIAEAYRAIRTAIYFGLQGQPAKTILITSPSAGDGKTTLASNLAIAIAQAGRRVLLIDADCWHPTQHEIFGLGEAIGLTHVLRKKNRLEDVARKTDIENLDVLPCGEIPSRPSELLDSPALLELLNEASSRYDQVLIDSPPVVPITDARILAANCGATILVLRAGKSTRRLADDAFEALNSVGAPILGIVVNDVVRQSHSRAHQYYSYTSEHQQEDWDRYAPVGQTNAQANEQTNAQTNSQTDGHADETNPNGNGNLNGNGTGYGHIVHLPAVIDATATEPEAD